MSRDTQLIVVVSAICAGGAVLAGLLLRALLGRPALPSRTAGDCGDGAADDARAGQGAEADDAGEQAAYEPADEGDLATRADGDGTARHAHEFDVSAFCQDLMATDDPEGLLEDWLAGHASDEPDDEDPLEAYLARSLCELSFGEEGEGAELPAFRVVRPTTSGLLYLRVEEPRVAFGGYLRVVSLEAALNGLVLAEGLLRGSASYTLEDVYRALQTLDARVAAQATDAPRPMLPRLTDVMDSLTRPADDAEWTERMAVSRDIECLRLPWRLTARFRINRAGGEAAVVFDLTPASAMRRSACVRGAGIVPATRSMRRRAASAYALRVALLLAARVLADCPEVGRVWVASSLDTPSRHVCHLSAALAREDLAAVDLARDFDPYVLCRALGFRMRVRDGVLLPVEQGFSLDDERFCPPGRFDREALAAHGLDEASARAFGAEGVWGLAIEGDGRRARLADELLRAIPADGGEPSCEACVRALMGVARADGSAEALDAARRTAARLVEGTLPPDPLAVAEDFAGGEGALADALGRARALAGEGRTADAARLLAQELALVDEGGTYRDGTGVEWRSFASYADRVLYNRLLAREGATCRMAPAVYLEAHESLASLLLATGDAEGAVSHARRAVALCPTNALVRLLLVRCLEEAGDEAEARDQLWVALGQAHSPQGLGGAYFHAACVMLGEGRLEAARACYQLARSYLPSITQSLAGDFAGLLLLAGLEALEPLGEREAREALEDAGVPLGPAFEVSEALLESTRAAVDGELFPVARELLRNLCALTRDDILYGMLRSLEDEPDR